MAADSKFAGNIMDVIPLVDTRHDFGDVSKDYYLEKGNYIDCFENFTNNLQRQQLFGNGAAARELSKRLTSTCKGRGTVMGGSPEAEFVEFVEDQIGLQHNPGNLAPARAVVGGLQLNGLGAAGVSNGVGGLGQGFVKVIIPSQTNLPVGLAGQAEERYNIVDDGTEEDYKRYHRAIARALGWRSPILSVPSQENGFRRPIPVVVDTTKSLNHRYAPYFIVCRNREHMTDPSPTSDMAFDFAAEEVVEDDRVHTINGVRHTIGGTLREPTIHYKTNNMRADSPGVQYQYGGKGKSPNAIEVCKIKIKDAVDEIIRNSNAPGAGGINYYQTFNGGANPEKNTINGLIAFFNKDCTIYNTLGYNNANINPQGGDPAENLINRIVIPYIAKRGGDQLQVESCRSRINYILKRAQYLQKPNAHGNNTFSHWYLNVNSNGNPIAAGEQYAIDNCVFWTYDRVAAMYAVLRGVTTVLQTATKDAIIYKKIRNGVDPAPLPRCPFYVGILWVANLPLYRFETLAAANNWEQNKIRPNGQVGGAVCTRDDVQRVRGELHLGALVDEVAGRRAFSRSRRVSDECFYNLMVKLCTPGTNVYEPFTLLKFINYYINTRVLVAPQTWTDNPLYVLEERELELSIDRCIGLRSETETTIRLPNGTNYRNAQGQIVRIFQPYYLQGAPPRILNIPGMLIERGVGADGNIRITIGDNVGVYHLHGLGGILSLLAIPGDRMTYFNYIREIEGLRLGGGDGRTFYDKWAEVQDSYNQETAKELFIDFLELLSYCENQYFANRDSADNFYVYNPIPVLHGGHTQYQMMAFLDTLIKHYNDRKSQASKLDTLLKCFIYFPKLLKNMDLESILIDIRDYISVWFNYETLVDSDIEFSQEEVNLFKTIINESQKTVNKLNANLSIIDEKCADYLNTIFPHGYFVIKYNEIKPVNSSNNKRANSKSINKSVITKNKLNNTNMNKLINNMKRLSVKPKIRRPGTVPALLTSRNYIFGGKHLTKKKRKNKRKTHKKRKY
jgi:hypothetical protein